MYYLQAPLIQATVSKLENRLWKYGRSNLKQRNLRIPFYLRYSKNVHVFDQFQSSDENGQDRLTLILSACLSLCLDGSWGNRLLLQFFGVQFGQFREFFIEEAVLDVLRDHQKK